MVKSSFPAKAPKVRWSWQWLAWTKRQPCLRSLDKAEGDPAAPAEAALVEQVGRVDLAVRVLVDQTARAATPRTRMAGRLVNLAVLAGDQWDHRPSPSRRSKSA